MNIFQTLMPHIDPTAESNGKRAIIDGLLFAVLMTMAFVNPLPYVLSFLLLPLGYIVTIILTIVIVLFGIAALFAGLFYWMDRKKDRKKALKSIHSFLDEVPNFDGKVKW